MKKWRSEEVKKWRSGEVKNMEKVNRFRSLIVWQKGHQLVLNVYRITKSFPEEEKFGIVPQMRRAVISITTNISEGYRKVGKKINYVSSICHKVHWLK